MKDVSGTVKQRTREIIGGWTARFAITVPDVAIESLQAGLAHFIQQSADALARIDDQITAGAKRGTVLPNS